MRTHPFFLTLIISPFVDAQHGQLPSFTQFPAQLHYFSHYISSLSFTSAQNGQNRMQLSLCCAQCTAPITNIYSKHSCTLPFHSYFNRSGSMPPISISLNSRSA
ncbi:hypothetical protein BDR05DRAFT_794479 [Suillus weaverae]|nr:hypothetical protein BDR05DRAFT_794479 [Suillus weaverae]